MSEIVDRWRSLQRGPRVPRQQEPPRTPRYDVREIQSINPTPAKLAAYRERESRVAPRFPQRRELTAQEMGSLYPQLIAKRPELLNRLAKRGVTYYIDPLLSRDASAAGTYTPATKEVAVQLGQGIGVAAHETVHAYQATSWVNPVRFLLDKRYRAARSSALVLSGDTVVGKALRLALFAAGGDVPGRVVQAGYQSEVFAMGAYGESAYPDLPVDYTEARYLFGGSFER